MNIGFVTETEVLELRKKRQEEWERVRQPGDALERPEEPYDTRSLFEKLQEQKEKKDLEYEEAHKLKNMIKGLDDDEIEFLDLVDRTKSEVIRKKECEEERELLDYRNQVLTLQEKYIDDMYQANIVINQTKTNKQPMSQKKSLKGIVIKKKHVDSDSIEEPKKKKIAVEKIEDKPDAKNSDCANIVLPGIGCYKDSSSENEDNTEAEEILEQSLKNKKNETKC